MLASLHTLNGTIMFALLFKHVIHSLIEQIISSTAF